MALTFDRALSPSNVPAASAFTVRDLLDEQIPTGSDWLNQTILSVAVRGQEVEFDVSPGIYACAPQPRVHYTQPATCALSNLGTGKVPSFSGQSITHLNAHRSVRAWAAAGLGEGTLTLTPKNPETGADDPALETDMSLGMAALGAKGYLVEPAGGSGFRLDLEANAFWVRTSSEKAQGLAAAEAEVTRLRLGLDGGYAFALRGAGSRTGDGGGTLEPTFEFGLRHDGDDAETGWGVDIGGGLRWHAPALGLSAEVAGRGLVAHEAAGLKDRGVSRSLAWDPDPASDRRPSLSLTQTMGAQAAGGADALLGRQTLADLAANDNGFENRRLELSLGYGLPALGDRFTSTPEFGIGLSDAGRDYRLGWRLGLVPGGASSFELGIEATRNEPANDAGTEPEHEIRLTLEARF